MTTLIDFLVPAVLVSSTALVAVRLADRAPSGVKLALLAAGLTAWFVPWPVFELQVNAESTLPLSAWVGESAAQWSSIKQDVAATIVTVAPVVSAPSPAWWLLVFVPGLAWFSLDLARYVATLRRWQRSSRCGQALQGLLPSCQRAGRVPRIRLVAGSSIAVATGLVRPTIWIGDRLVDADGLRAALCHEAKHLKRLDPAWFLLLGLIARLYWFNPIVRALKRQAVIAIEAGCDAECARLLGRRSYRKTLARLILDGQERDDPVLVPMLASPSIDLSRLRLLRIKSRVDARCWVAVAALICACIGGGTLAAAAPRDLWTGNWMEVADSSRYGYDVPPGWRRFEGLADGLTRIHGNVGGDDTPRIWTDVRCDGRDYPSRVASGGLGSTLACEDVDPWTRLYFGKSVDGREVVLTTETVSPDGETIDEIVRRTIAGTTSVTQRTFMRLR